MYFQTKPKYIPVLENFIANCHFFKRKVLIYDLGGGTLDVSVIEITQGNIDIKATGGDNHLGGDDFDSNMVDYCLDLFNHETKLKVTRDSNLGDIALKRLRYKCEEHKWQLSSSMKTLISLDHFYNGNDLNIELTREKFEKLNSDLFVKSMNIVQQTVDDANFKNSDIDDIVLVGGSTRIPKIRDMLENLFNGKALNYSINPEEAVAVGAAIQAAILNGEQAQGLKRLTISDVAPMSLGVKVKGGFMSVIIPRNSPVPNKYTKQYETTSDHQSEVEIVIYEGEETMAVDNRKLNTFKLKNIPPGVAGEQIIDVTFEIDEEGILHAKGKIVSNNEEQEIEITEHKNIRLSYKELDKLIDLSEE